jgi:hypothetical protein
MLRLAASLQGCGGRGRGGLLAPLMRNDKEMKGFFVSGAIRIAAQRFRAGFGAFTFIGWIVSPRTSMATNVSIRASLVSGFLAL